MAKETTPNVNADFVPDIPAQIEETKVEPVVEQIQEPETKKQEAAVTPVIEEQLPAVVEETESEEVLFLRNILAIQHNGGWGHHLDDVINERIKSLTA